jgi:Kae1-associated kinase Bud32
MEFIDGKPLSKNLDKLSNYRKICKQVGKDLAKLHNSGIIHGDLTTSNILLEKKTSKIFFIDFGLSFHSNRIEDKAVDLHLIKEALEAKHPKIFKNSFKKILKGYKKSENFQKVLTRLEKVESRGRYKSSDNKTLKN